MNKSLSRPSSVCLYQFLSRHSRCFSLSTSSSIKSPEKPSKSWERSAEKVKNVQLHKSHYLDKIRDSHDPSQHIKTIEDELKETIGRALGKQGDKVLEASRKMQQQYEQYKHLLHEMNYPESHAQVQEVVRQYNQYRGAALQARWELMVHRQAVGFIVDNHKFVTKTFPIADALPVVVDECNRSTYHGNKGMEQDAKNDKFGDQLDWWQRIGRWK